MISIGRRLVSVGDALSQLLNVLLLPDIEDTNANESISGRCHRKDWKIPKGFINFLFFLQEDHCKLAFEKDLQRARELTERFK
jgi:hypothetical protein